VGEGFEVRGQVDCGGLLVLELVGDICWTDRVKGFIVKAEEGDTFLQGFRLFLKKKNSQLYIGFHFICGY